jgi:hypothetical protein
MAGENIDQKPAANLVMVNFKEYAEHNFIEKRKTFIGLRDTKAFERLAAVDLQHIFYEYHDRKTISGPEYEAIKKCYNWYPQPDFFNAIGNAVISVLSKNSPYLNITTRQEYVLDSDVTIEERAYLWPILTRIFNVSTRYSETVQEALRKNPAWYPDDTLDRLKTIRNKYVIIFRQIPGTREIRRCTEYYATNEGLWQHVPLDNRNPQSLQMRDDRQPEGAGGTSFFLPDGQQYWALLTGKKLTARRVEKIRLELQKQQSYGETGRLTKMPIFEDTCVFDPERRRYLDVLRDLRRRRSRGEDFPEFTENQRFQELCRNTIVEEGSETPTIILTDYWEQAEEWRNRFNSADEEYRRHIGQNETETEARQLENRLKYLTIATCDGRNAWQYVNERHYADLIDKYREIQLLMTKRAVLAKRLSWWFNQSGFSEYLYDIFYDCVSRERNQERLSTLVANEITSEMDRLLNGLENIPEARPGLKTICQRTLSDYKLGLGEKGIDTRRYWDWQAEDPANYFEVLELYEEYRPGANFFIEVLYPNTLNYKTDIVPDILHRLGPSLADAFEYNVDQLTAWIKRFGFGDIAVINHSGALSGRRWAKPVTKNLLGRQGTTGIDVLEGLRRLDSGWKKVILAIDTALLMRDISKEGMTAENVAGILSVAIGFAKVWKNIDENVVASRVANLSMDTIRIINAPSLARIGWKNIFEIIDIVLGLIDFSKLALDDDWDAAFIRGGGAVVFGLLGIASNSIAALILLALCMIGSRILADMVQDDEFDKWIKYGEYGTHGDRLTGNAWRNYYTKFIALNGSGEYNDRIARNDWGNTEVKILTYYRLLYNFSIKRCYGGYFFNGEMERQFQFIEIIFNASLLIDDICFTAKLVEFRNNAEYRTIIGETALSLDNCFVWKKTQGGGLDIYTYFYIDQRILYKWLRYPYNGGPDFGLDTRDALEGTFGFEKRYIETGDLTALSEIRGNRGADIRLQITEYLDEGHGDNGAGRLLLAQKNLKCDVGSLPPLFFDLIMEGR